MLTVTIALVLVVLLGHRPVLSRRRHAAATSDREQLMAAIAAELRSGHSLRLAVAAATAGNAELSAVGRLARAGAPLQAVVDALASEPRLRAAFTVAARSGGRAALVFQRLADRAAAETDAARQRRVLTAQARLSAFVVAGMPLVWLVFGGVGRIRSLIDSGAGVVAVLGLLMELGGVLLVWRMASQ